MPESFPNIFGWIGAAYLSAGIIYIVIEIVTMLFDGGCDD